MVDEIKCAAYKLTCEIENKINSFIEEYRVIPILDFEYVHSHESDIPSYLTVTFKRLQEVNLL